MRAILTSIATENEASSVSNLALDAACTVDISDASSNREEKGEKRIHIAGFFIRPTIENFVPCSDFALGLPQEYLLHVQRNAHERAERLQAIFENTVCAHKEKHARARGDKSFYPVDIEWIDAEGTATSLLGLLGRVFDLCVVPKPGTGEGTNNAVLFESAIFETGRPVLVTPPDYQAKGTLGNTVALVWNGSSETARTLAFAMPLLKNIVKIYVITVEGKSFPGPGGTDVVRYLSRHDITAVARHICLGKASVGEAIMDEAKRLGCDWMIKGAYTQNRLQQMIFGGATSYILDNVTLPVFMAH